jgi:hypothetical protein
MPFFVQIVASQDWPEVTNGQELISDLFEVPHVDETGAMSGGMIKYDLI